jgi:hypothetical protein
MSVDTDAAVETTVTPDRTVVEYRGAGDAAVVIRSAAGERVYLPLFDEQGDEDEDEGDPGSQTSPYGGDDPGDSPYGGGGTANEETESSSVYDGIGDDATPYGGSEASPYGGDRGPEPGIRPTSDGFRVVHPEPATDVRVLR